MAEYTIFKLKNISSLHIGTGKESYDFSSDVLSSDVISSALASVRAMQGKTEGLDQFLTSFAISSAFPYYGDMLFLPRPMGKIPVKVDGLDEYQYRKGLKKVKYVERTLWNDMVSGNELCIGKDQLQGDFIVPGRMQFSTPSKKQVMQRVCVPRDGENAEPFFFEWQFFDRLAGLYCIVDAEHSVVDDLFELFVNLGEMGIGSDKSVGGGRFDVEKSSVILPAVANASASMLLSTFIPAEQDRELLNLGCAKYAMVLRSGYMAGSNIAEFHHLRKRSVYMFDAGSIFPTVDSLSGKVVDLRPEWNDEKMHPVYRGGKPFVVQIHPYKL